MLVMITGAAGGLGRAFAVECAARGYDLLLTDMNESALESVRNGLLRQYDVRIYAQRCDLTRDEEVRELVGYAFDNGIRLDMLLNVAGLDHEGGFAARRFDQIAGILRVNIEATLRVTHEALALRRPDSRFYVVFVSSLASMVPMPLKATYAASKRFLLDFSIALGQELKGLDIRVLSLCPAGLPTTDESIRGIAAQGFWGSVTTNKLERVVHRTISRVLNGRRVYIPGLLNRAFGFAGKLLPACFVARVLYARWSYAQQQWLTT